MKTCTICNLSPTTPVMLSPCGHTFDKHCIIREQEKNKNMNCPSCQSLATEMLNQQPNKPVHITVFYEKGSYKDLTVDEKTLVKSIKYLAFKALSPVNATYDEIQATYELSSTESILSDEKTLKDFDYMQNQSLTWNLSKKV